MALPGAPPERRPTRRRRLLIGAVVLVAAAGTTVGYAALSTPDASMRFCSADARIGPGGETYSRSGSHDCRFVDDDGDVLDGSPP